MYSAKRLEEPWKMVVKYKGAEQEEDEQEQEPRDRFKFGRAGHTASKSGAGAANGVDDGDELG